MWPHAIVTVIGLWLMAAPEVLGLERSASISLWVAGPLLATFATVAWWGATRAVRWWNLPVTAWLVFAPLVLEHTAAAALNSIACGCVAGALSMLKGRVHHSFGGGWRSLWRRSAARDTLRTDQTRGSSWCRTSKQL